MNTATNTLRADHIDYAAEAKVMTQLAHLDAFFAERSGSRSEIDTAIRGLADAAAMQQRATWSAPAGSDIAHAHHAATELLNKRARELRKARATATCP